MKFLGLDFHSCLGLSGLIASLSFSDAHQVLACLVCLATLIYMAIRAIREWRKFISRK